MYSASVDYSNSPLVAWLEALMAVEAPLGDRMQARLEALVDQLLPG